MTKIIEAHDKIEKMRVFEQFIEQLNTKNARTALHTIPYQVDDNVAKKCTEAIKGIIIKELKDIEEELAIMETKL